MSLPQDFAVISEHRRWRFFVFFVLYVAQGISFGLILMAIPAYLAAKGVDAGSIAGFVSIALLPHAIKLINAPLMDRWTYRVMGKRRPWVLTAQAALILSLLLLSLVPDPASNLAYLTGCCFVVNFFTGFQDVATDGMAVDLLPFEDQPKASGIMFGGATLSGAAFAAATGWTLSAYGISATVLACAGVVFLISLVPLVARERPGERLLPWSEGQAHPGHEAAPGTFREIVSGLKHCFLQPASLLLAGVITTYGITRGIHLALLPNYYVQELGWTDTAFSSVSGIALLAGGGTAILFGGALQDFFGRRRMSMLGCGLAAGFAVVVAMLPTLGDSELVMAAYRVAYNTLDTLIIVTYISIGMAISTPAVAATQFALYMALSNVGYSLGSAIFGSLQLSFSNLQIFLIFAAIVAGCIVIIQFLVIEPRNADLEAARAPAI